VASEYAANQCASLRAKIDMAIDFFAMHHALSLYCATMMFVQWIDSMKHKVGDLTMKPTLFKASAAKFESIGEGSGSASIASIVSKDSGETMAASLLKLDGRDIPWTLRYDELIVVLEGKIQLKTQEGTIKASAGDTVWLPKGSEVRYEGEKALAFIGVSMAD
jgi:ethanolamine utilization protein EutQ